MTRKSKSTKEIKLDSSLTSNAPATKRYVNFVKISSITRSKQIAEKKMGRLSGKKKSQILTMECKSDTNWKTCWYGTRNTWKLNLVGQHMYYWDSSRTKPNGKNKEKYRKHYIWGGLHLRASLRRWKGSIQLCSIFKTIIRRRGESVLIFLSFLVVFPIQHFRLW